MHKTSYIIILVLIILSCNSQRSIRTNEKSLTSEIRSPEIKNEFLDFYNELPELKLPFKITCGIEPTEKYSGIVIENIPGFFAIAKIKQPDNSKTKVILGYYQTEIRYPYLFSFNENGTKIDSITIHNGNCATDPWIEENCWAEVLSFDRIIMVDTSRYYFYNDTIRRLDSTVILKEQISIIKTGNFKTNKLK